MKLRNTTYIEQVSEMMDSIGEAEIPVPVHEMMSVLGTIRLLGFRAYVLPNGNMKVEPKPAPKERGRPTGLIYGAAMSLLEANGDPTTMEVDNTSKAQTNLRYHGLYSSKKDLNTLIISKSPIQREMAVIKTATTEESIEDFAPDLVNHINLELPYTEAFGSPKEAKTISDKLRRTYGRLLLIRIVQWGESIVLEYKKRLPTKLPKDYPPETIEGWTKALAREVGPDQAYSHYNAHARRFKTKLISKKEFDKLIG